MYPKCPVCGKGTLLPFFDKDGTNIYVCTVCHSKFGVINEDGEVYAAGDFGYSYEFGYEKGKGAQK